MSNSCCICLEEKDVKKLPCCTSSFVHKECIGKYVDQYGDTCPVCRQDILFEEFIDIIEFNVCKERLYEVLLIISFMFSIVHLISSIMTYVVFYKIYET